MSDQAKVNQVQAESRWYKFWREWRGFFAFIVVMLLFRSAVADWNQVPSGSMLPSILIGDRIVVNKMAYDLRVPFTLIRLASWEDPQRSDIITFDSPHDGKLLVKRVVGVPGDVVEMRNNRLIINGERASYGSVDEGSLPEPITAVIDDWSVKRESVLGNERTVMTRLRPNRHVSSTFGPITVPANQYLVLGDNRDNSADSRVIGFVDRSLILGRANSIAFSIDFDRYWLRSERFFKSLD